MLTIAPQGSNNGSVICKLKPEFRFEKILVNISDTFNYFRFNGIN